jgi:CTP:molybdopterin cytidylyltransferase MocA
VTTAVVPAAGQGSRLGRPEPKALVDLGGQTLLGRVLWAVEPSVEGVVLVVRPGTEQLFDDELRRLGWSKGATLVVQPEATGSADAVAVGLEAVAAEEPCVVVWADQVGVSRRTIGRVAGELDRGFAGLVLPLVEMPRPYVWFTADGAGLAVFRQRDGDEPPAVGRSDVGTFGFPSAVGLAAIAGEMAGWTGSARERDFVYVLPALARRHGVRIVDVDDPGEALGVNDPTELQQARRTMSGTGAG